MPFNVLLLPLLGGYVFISRCNRFRFDAARYRGQRLVFNSAIAGALLLGWAYLVTRLLGDSYPDCLAAWREWVPYPNTGTGALALVSGFLFAEGLNLLYFDRSAQEELAVKRWGDFLEALLIRCMKGSDQVSVSLDSGKVYIGWVTGTFNQEHDRRYIRLFPTISGYRHSETKRLVVTTEYVRAYSYLLGEDSPGGPFNTVEGHDAFELVLPVSSISSANYFDPKVFALFDSEAGARS